MVNLNEWLSFINSHLYLLIFTILILAVLSFEEINDWLLKPWLIEPDEAVGWINHENAKVLDMRSLEEFNKQHIIESKHTNLAQLLTINPKQSGKTILVIDSNKTPSLTLRRHLVKLKLQGRVKILKGGIAAWQAAGFLLVH